MKKILFFISLCLAIGIIVHLVTSIYTLWHKQDVVVSAEKELQKQQAENKALKQQFKTVTVSGFVEEEARNKLFWVKPGEQEVMIAKETATPTKTPQATKDTRPYWQQWISVFFH